MSRFRRVIHSTLSGYTALAATALYALVSVPLALHYLSTEQFALWALMSGIGGYLSLIDLGMSGSLARLLIDHKDDKQAGTYGSLVKTGWLVLAIQGALLLAVGYCLAPLLARLLHIESAVAADFVQLLRWQSTALALGFAARISTHLLSAHQRMDIIYYLNITSLAASLLLQWLFFYLGAGVFSLAWGNLLATLAGAAVSQWVCWRLGFFPPAGAWGRMSWHLFRELFNYGRDLFLITLGNQLISASQTMIVTRVLGLEAAAAWSVGTRAFTYLVQFVWRVWEVATPMFSEMLAREEQQLFRERYRSLFSLTVSLSCYAVVGYALCNSLFVTVWTHGKISWSPLNDILLGGWMVVQMMQRCHNTVMVLTKRVGFMRYVYFCEGLAFVSLGLLAARHYGFMGMIGCSILCCILFSGAYGVWRISRYFQVPLAEVVFTWPAPMLKILLLFVPIALACGWGARAVEGTLPKLLLCALLAGTAGGYIFLRLGVRANLQAELLQRAPRLVKPALARLFA